MASKGQWRLAKHHQAINSRLVDVADGKIRRLLISMPPRHGKSELISKYTPPWYLGKFPSRRIILTAYEANFAASWGRKCRDLINEHEDLLGIRVDPGLARAGLWQVDGHEGGMLSVGVGGPCTGYGADLLLFDDPIKNSEQANSITYRDRVWEWWQSTAYTRLMPGGTVIGIMTRWHEDDLIGRILKHSSEHWEVLNLPAIAEEDDPLGRQPGEALWPDQFPLEELERIKSTLGSYYWSALYGGSPTPRDGGFFKSEWFRFVDQIPVIEPPKPPPAPPGLCITPAYTTTPKAEEYDRVRAWDLAATEDGDWTVGVKMAKHGSMMFVEDVIRVRLTPAHRDALILKTAQEDGTNVKVWIEQEPGSGGISQVQTLRTKLQGYAVGSERSTGSKQVRADPMAAQLEAGNLVLVRGHWNSALTAEMASFPNAKHDDQVDAASLAFNKLASKRKLTVM